MTSYKHKSLYNNNAHTTHMDACIHKFGHAGLNGHSITLEDLKKKRRRKKKKEWTATILQIKSLKQLYKCIITNTSAIWQHATHIAYQLTSPSCSTRAIPKKLTEKYWRVLCKTRQKKWQHATHTTYQLSSPSCSTRAIPKSLSLNENYWRILCKRRQKKEPLAHT